MKGIILVDNMSHYQKLYENIKSNPKNVSFDDIDILLTKVGGFTRREPKGGSSHYTYHHPDLNDILTIVKKEKPVKAFYIKKAIQYFEMVVDDFI